MADRSPFDQRLKRGVVLLDGGLGSLLIASGLEAGQAPERWNIDHPDRITAAHRQYVEAGSDVIHTNTFGASPPKLLAAGIKAGCREVNRVAMAAARAACEGHDTLIAGDIGPTGLLYPPMGAAVDDALRQAFDAQVEALDEAGVDVFSVETMYDLREAKQAVAAAAATGRPVIASMTFENKRRGNFTIVGDQLGPSLVTLADAGATVVGLNCSVESTTMIEMISEARQATDSPLCAQPNAGQPRATAEGVTYDADPATFCQDMLALIDAGVQVIGGCCGTDARFIKAIRAAIDSRARS